MLPFNWDATIARLDIGILYVLALATFPTLGIIMAGWASYNKYTLLGGMRAAAQLISYEVPEVLSVLPIVLLAGTLSLWGISAAQEGTWFILAPVVGPLGFVTLLYRGLAELNRSPFDLPEAGVGDHRRASTWNTVACASPCSSWPSMPTPSACPPWHDVILRRLAGLAAAGLCLVLREDLRPVPGDGLGRGTLPRLRYDQLMACAWKVLPSANAVNVVLAAVVKGYSMALASFAIKSLSS